MKNLRVLGILIGQKREAKGEKTMTTTGKKVGYTEGEIVECSGCGAETVVVGGFVRDDKGEWVKAEHRPFHSCDSK